MTTYLSVIKPPSPGEVWTWNPMDGCEPGYSSAEETILANVGDRVVFESRIFHGSKAIAYVDNSTASAYLITRKLLRGADSAHHASQSPQ